MRQCECVLLGGPQSLCLLMCRRGQRDNPALMKRSPQTNKYTQCFFTHTHCLKPDVKPAKTLWLGNESNHEHTCTATRSPKCVYHCAVVASQLLWLMKELHISHQWIMHHTLHNAVLHGLLIRTLCTADMYKNKCKNNISILIYDMYTFIQIIYKQLQWNNGTYRTRRNNL